MVKANPSTIALKGPTRYDDGVAGGAITPGHLIDIDDLSAIVVEGTGDKKQSTAFALEYDLIGNGIDDAYVSGDRVKFGLFQPGEEVYALVADGTAAIALGASLTGSDDGTLKPTVTAGDEIAQALEAVDNSAGGAPVRIKVRIL